MAQVRCRGMAQVYLPGAMPLTSSVAWHGSSGEERHGRTLYYRIRITGSGSQDQDYRKRPHPQDPVKAFSKSVRLSDYVRHHTSDLSAVRAGLSGPADGDADGRPPDARVSPGDTPYTEHRTVDRVRRVPSAVRVRRRGT